VCNPILVIIRYDLPSDHIMEYVLFGWRNVELEVPDNWFLAADGGSEKKGYFRLDDSLQPRLELVWEYVPFEKALAPSILLEKHKETLEKHIKKAKKKGLKIPEVKTVMKREIKVSGHSALLWVNRMEESLNNAVVWYCEKSERAFVLNLFFRLDEEETSRRILNRVTKSIKCHFPQDYKVLWSLYVAPIRLPLSFNLVSIKLTVGLSYIVYKDADEYLYLIIGYSGLIKQILSKYKKGLVEWFSKGVKKNTIDKIERFRRIKFEKRNNEVTLYKKNFSLIRSKANVLYGKIWLDEKLNRIFAVSVITKIKKFEEARELVEDVSAQLTSVST